MIIIDTLLAERAASGHPVRVGMFGAGFMARGIANQIANSVPGMELVAICNRTLPKAMRAYEEAGVDNAVAVACRSALDAAIDESRPAVTDNPDILCQAAGIDCIIEVTGALEYGANATLAAIKSGKH